MHPTLVSCNLHFEGKKYSEPELFFCIHLSEEYLDGKTPVNGFIFS